VSRIPFPIGTCISCKLENKKLIAKHCFEAPSFCYQKYQQEKYRAKQVEKPKKKKTAIKPVSDKMLDKLKHYRRLRDKFLAENPVCMFPGCNCREVTLHHARGRVGAFLTDKRYFKSLCWPHHQYVESHPDEARKLGLSYCRLHSNS